MDESVFRGSNEIISSVGTSNQSGKFLNLINLVSHYHEPLLKHIEKHKTWSFLFFSWYSGRVSRDYYKKS